MIELGVSLVVLACSYLIIIAWIADAGKFILAFRQFIKIKPPGGMLGGLKVRLVGHAGIRCAAAPGVNLAVN